MSVKTLVSKNILNFQTITLTGKIDFYIIEVFVDSISDFLQEGLGDSHFFENVNGEWKCLVYFAVYKIDLISLGYS